MSAVQPAARASGMPQAKRERAHGKQDQKSVVLDCWRLQTSTPHEACFATFTESLNLLAAHCTVSKVHQAFWPRRLAREGLCTKEKQASAPSLQERSQSSTWRRCQANLKGTLAASAIAMCEATSHPFHR
eukprot:738304-Amphidinium_carterae.1